MAEEPRCYICDRAENEPAVDGDPTELRPYGPNMQWLCFECMTASPEREAEAKRQFSQQIDAAGDVVLIGETTGPRSLTRRRV